jgi:ribonucleoside-diphosphate reductase alpha chain
MDNNFRRLALDYLPFEKRAALGIYSAEERKRRLETGSYEAETGPDVAETSDAESLKATSAVETPVGDSLEEPVVQATAKPAPGEAHTWAELLEVITGSSVDAPLCRTCRTRMRPPGSCFVREGCGSTSGSSRQPFACCRRVRWAFSLSNSHRELPSRPQGRI